MKTRFLDVISRWKTKHIGIIFRVGRLLRIPDKYTVVFPLPSVFMEEPDYDDFIGQVSHVLLVISMERKLSPPDYYLFKQFVDCTASKPIESHIRRMFVELYVDYRQNPRNIREAFIDLLLEQGHVNKPEAEELKGLIA